METRAPYVLIGAFVLAAAAAAMLVILWFSQTQREFDEYEVIFRERVSGLTVGAQVSFNGIQKGEVVELNIDPEDPNVVRALVRVGNDTPIKTDTKAELELVGFTGLAIIQFVGGSPDQPLLKDTVRGTPEIEASTTGLSQIFEGSNDIITAARKLLSDDNIEAFNSILVNLDTFVETFANEEESITATLQNLASITEDISAMTDKLDAVATNLETLLGDDAPAALQETEQTVREARALISDLRAVVEENREPISEFTDQGLAQLGPTLSEARRMFKTLDQVLREIDRDPRGYLLGESTPQSRARGRSRAPIPRPDGAPVGGRAGPASPWARPRRRASPPRRGCARARLAGW
ncbi:MAG: MlaD family protein, partial [Pseudomonadota bacterium]